MGKRADERRRYGNLIINEPYKIGHWLGFKDLTPLNNEWIRSFLFAEIDQTLQAHRGSYKTTSLFVALTLLMLLKANDNMLFFRKTDTDVAEIIKQVSRALESDVIGTIADVFYSKDIELLKNTDSEIHTNLSDGVQGASQLLGLGIGTSITGKHAPVIITDDIVNLKDRVSRAERERTKMMYQELQNVKNRGGRFINTGTPWHKDDAFKLMPNLKRYDCYSTGMINEKEREALRLSMTSSLFAANYELKHIADEDAIFKDPQYLTRADADGVLHNGIAHIDAAYGGEDGTALTLGREEEGKIYIYGKRWNSHVDKCIDEAIGIVKRFKCGTIHCERNADKGYLRRDIKAKGHPAEHYHESMNKYIKISTYGVSRWKDIWFHPDTDPGYINEILDYSENADHDDSPDSLASLIRKFEKKTTVKTFRGGI